MNYRVCIVEDDKASADKLKAFLSEYGQERECEFNISVYGNALGFLQEFANNFDIIFMDIELPFRNGMDVVRQIRERDKKVIVIFVTNMAQYAVKGYEVDAFDFIVKPVVYSAFAIKLDRAIERFKTLEDKEIWINERTSKRRLRTSEIRYVEVMHHNLVFHTTGGDYTTYGQLKDVIEMLAGLPFSLCNRCFLVNLGYVSAIEEFSVTITGGEKLQISRSRKKNFLTDLNAYLGGK